MAVEGGAQAANTYIVATDETVIGMGGFDGRDPAPSTDQLTAWVRAGKLRFVLIGGLAGGGMGDDNRVIERSKWIEQHCKPVLTAIGEGETLHECTVG
jgi:hypothetical protein